MGTKVPFKKVFFSKFMVSENIETEMKQNILDDIASNLKFQRCPASHQSSRGFVPFYDGSEAEEAYSYSKNGLHFFKIMTEEKKISKSEFNFEVQQEKNRVLKKENIIMSKEEINEFKENLFNEKIKTAPSTFKTISFGFDVKGNFISNITSEKENQKLMDFITHVFSDFFIGIIGSIHQNVMLAATSLVKNNKCEISNNYVSFGLKGEAKKDGKRITFSDISADKKELINLSVDNDLSMTKVEFIYAHEFGEINFYVSDKGLEKIEFGYDMLSFVEDEISNLEDDFEIFDFNLDLFINVATSFEKEILGITDQTIKTKNSFEKFNHAFHNGKEFADFLK